MRRWIPCLATLLLALAVCGKAAPPPSAEAPARTGPACPKELETGNLGDTVIYGTPIPDDFTTTWVLRCRSDVRPRPGEGKWLVALSERADTPATALVVELRKPSDPRSTELCTPELVATPYFVLVDANGRTVLPAVPTDGCGKPRREALAELDKLSFRTVAERPVKQLEPPEPTETKCADSARDELAIIGRLAVEQPVPKLSFSSGAIKVCVYDRVSGGDVPTGKLSKGRTRTADEAAALVGRLRKLGPAKVCSAKHTRFAVLITDRPVDDGRWGSAELDGCRRLLLPLYVQLQLDDQTIAELAG